MDYKFYDRDALIKEQISQLSKNRFGISTDTYNSIIDDRNTDSELLFLLLTKRNKFDICDGTVQDGIPQDIADALYYDSEYHPDEVVFVTTDKEKARTANLYFGEDSIMVI